MVVSLTHRVTVNLHQIFVDGLIFVALDVRGKPHFSTIGHKQILIIVMPLLEHDVASVGAAFRLIPQLCG